MLASLREEVALLVEGRDLRVLLRRALPVEDLLERVHAIVRLRETERLRIILRDEKELNLPISRMKMWNVPRLI